MSKKVILVTGGQRSGKSGYAQRLALSLSPNPVYLATSRIWDEEFRKRVERHQRDRGPEWTNIEEEKYLSRHDLTCLLYTSPSPRDLSNLVCRLLLF